ncbi:unnamed protein product [Adineta ricciae]|uniref:LysM domain-containing protein n=1 Tax=Adineta ricciae TaxID=249248 RepID=A0A815L3G0_ADIRI|nr:unnamed protein product [Adineta ricciae]CAF1426983.1 unnamed protein product [Adineta ricciae]
MKAGDTLWALSKRYDIPPDEILAANPDVVQIAYPKSDGYPTKHNSATEDQGIYEDPITFATNKRELDIGTMIYVPFLRKYFIMEDLCESAVRAWDQGQYTC